MGEFEGRIYIGGQECLKMYVRYVCTYWLFKEKEINKIKVFEIWGCGCGGSTQEERNGKELGRFMTHEERERERAALGSRKIGGS